MCPCTYNDANDLPTLFQSLPSDAYNNAARGLGTTVEKQNSSLLKAGATPSASHVRTDSG